jgi:polysaccharide biosynthesis protein PslH
MRFLWLTRFVPYPPRYGGDVTYTVKLLEYLADITPVDVLCYREHDAPIPQRPGLTWHLLPWARNARWRSVVAAHPNVAAQYRRPSYIQQMVALAERADAIVLDHLGMAWCAAVLDKHFAGRSRSARPALIFIPHDHHKSVRNQAASQVRNPVMRQVVTLDAWKATRLEHEAVRLTDGVVVLTERDQHLFESDHPGTRYLVLTPGYDDELVEQRTLEASIPERVCVLGGRGTFHKQLVLQQCLTALQANRPPIADIDVVGYIEPGLQSELQARYPGLVFRGYVEDIAAYLQTVRLGMMPDAIGGGFKLRALTYMFNRVPIVAVKGALAGMGFVPGVHYLEAPDMDSMVALAGTAVRDFPLLNRVSDAAFDYCRARFDWHDRAQALRTFAQEIRNPPQAKRSAS